MASNIFSRLLPHTAGSRSVYEELRERDDSSDAGDIEERAGMASVDEENLAHHDFQLDPALADAMGSQLGLDTSPTSNAATDRHESGRARAPRWLRKPRNNAEIDDGDDDVPLSLLIEGGRGEVPLSPLRPLSTTSPQGTNSVPIPGPVTRATRAKWQISQEQQQLHQEPKAVRAYDDRSSRGTNIHMIDRKEKALWRWTNVENLDNFLKDVYDYFLGNGIWSILLSRALNLLTLAFVVAFGTFLTSCVDYKKVPGSKEMSEILIPQCTKNMSGLANLLIWLFAFLWIVKVFQYILEIRKLRYMHDFYHYLLEIPDSDIQTISWQDVVQRLMALRDANPTTAGGISEKHRRFIGTQSKQRMDAHDIANRLMRRDNYLIALFNKDILDLTLPIPFLKSRPLFSKTLEWNLSLCILDYIFNDQGQVRPLFLKDTRRKALCDGLRNRFMFAGVMNVICAPFIITYFMMLYFFRYFNEYQRNPSQLSSRQFTPFAEWKFREFNELWHLFERRINMSYPFASRYIDQFPKDKTIQVSRFIAFVTGALASVLALASVIDPDIFLGFEITPERTVLFYLGVFGSIWAVARGVVPEENLVFDPEYALNNVIDYTHYQPNHWKGRLHSDDVRKEFAVLYQMKVVIFLEEILSIIFTPFVLWYSLPKCSERIVDFFREFTVHVDGLGHVCSFAVFDFKKGGNNVPQSHQSRPDEDHDLRGDYYATKDGKMLASYYNFLDNYATNPKQGAPYLHQAKSNRPQFHPPPNFPGLTSPTFIGQAHTSGMIRNNGADRPPRGSNRHTAPGIVHASQRTPRFAPIGGLTSPMTSVLLDPQHQPLPATMKAKHKLVAPSRLQASLKPPAEEFEDHEQAHPESSELQSRVSANVGDTYDSNTGESWTTTRAGIMDEDNNVNGDIPASSSDNDPGVLGLMVNFTRAQTEGRGAGVNI
ncbi:autophagy protein atg9 [Xylographa bjoerkii]|nr:autophagy protein atg9 [Xylographa bjoerkii]MCJ1395341.1 autophagy protein atg9 [Xylographa bjoerkii]MCJ1395595.1 autophagy protein atg9 [Xylographa bjoerkii]